jgi:transposase
MRGKKISEDLKYAIIALGNFHTVPEIEDLTAVSRRQIYRIRKLWETTGYVEPECMGKRGRPRFLTNDEEAVRFPHISQVNTTEMHESTSTWLRAFKKRPISTSKTFDHKLPLSWGWTYHEH